jgi:pyruvate dehydrogenase E2 component (dihydrolipoamide acetyltransferase)
MIADRMMQSLHGTAQLTFFAEASMTALSAVLQAYRAAGSVLSVEDTVAFAAVRALVEHPAFNATVEGNRITLHPDVNLGIAVHGPGGLLVPVVPAAQRLTLPALASARAARVAEARAGRLAPGALRGGTFTLSNVGAGVVLHFTPILYPGQVALLGVGARVLRAVERHGTVVHEPSIPLSLTVDHRVIDGVPAAAFLRTLADWCADVQRWNGPGGSAVSGGDSPGPEAPVTGPC